MSAESLGRQWIGIDLSPVAATLVESRLRDQSRAKGGSDHIDNLQLLCGACNAGRADREVVAELIERFAATPPMQLADAHPSFGHMRPRDWDVLQYRHLDHHLRQFGVWHCSSPVLDQQTRIQPAMRPEGIVAVRLAETIARHYAFEVQSIARIGKGMGTTNWRVRTSASDYFLKQYPPGTDLIGEVAALELSQEARAAGVPAPRVIPSVTGEVLGAEGDLAFALFEYFPDANAGAALSCSEMAQAGHTLGRLHAFLCGRPGLRDTATEWLALDEGAKRAAFERYLQPSIGGRTRTRSIAGRCPSCTGDWSCCRRPPPSSPRFRRWRDRWCMATTAS